ncbi:uncharacterized protein LOC129723903 [Wyeomyia smithii]|uniref:uncharacterized protein LOC129723903 n=1 Tax=Wyeomyia smithii TaxID=174621 RepID=UPI002467E4F2|nr:uncharacterized protein LOC129723903 [Wyeomyia smithii]
MKKWIALLLVACWQIAMLDSAGVERNIENDTAVVTEFDRLFNQLHYDIDYKLRVYRMQHSLRLKNLNAQFISRYAFTITDIQVMKQHAKDEILEHALDIGDTQNPCIVAANDEALRRATQAARDLSIAAEKVYGDLATLSRTLFYPVVFDFQVTSSEFQAIVLDYLSRANPVLRLQETLADLAFFYMQNSNFVQTVEQTLDHEIETFQGLMNVLRQNIWQEIDEIGRSYVFNMEQLIEEALQCA